jgi:hypothetical protein
MEGGACICINALNSRNQIHMKGYIFCILGLFFARLCPAQTIPELSGFLANHGYSVSLCAPLQGDTLLRSVMQNKILFVYGEGGSHDLELNNQMRVYLLHQFSTLNLKYFFIEGARTAAYIHNQYLQNPDESSDSVYRMDTAFRNQMRQIKKLYEAGLHFEYKGIDMEWSRGFYRAVRSITKDLSPGTIDSIKLLHSILIDTNYFHYDSTSRFKNQAQFLKRYKQLKDLLLQDLGKLKACLDPEHYNELVYFLSNPQTAPPDGNRNPGMAENLLTEITPIDKSATYLLDIGSAHSLLSRAGAVVGILNSTASLSNKMVIMNVYCDNCSINGNVLKENLIEMKGEVLQAFRMSTKGNLTIFNVADAPSEFSYLKKYGSLILFAKNQH